MSEILHVESCRPAGTQVPAGLFNRCKKCTFFWTAFSQKVTNSTSLRDSVAERASISDSVNHHNTTMAGATEYTLHYWPWLSRGYLPAIVASVGGLSFAWDKGVQWPAFKPETPFGQLYAFCQWRASSNHLGLSSPQRMARLVSRWPSSVFWPARRISKGKPT